jgi:hypothetical protein
MSKLLLDIDFRRNGNSQLYVREGWAEPEITHRWTMGQQSRLSLPIPDPGPECVLVINATPCRHPPVLPAQTVMLAINERLLATIRFDGLHVAAYRLPAGLPRAGALTLDILHLNHATDRAPEQIRTGQPLGLMLHSVRIFRLGAEEAARSPPPAPATPKNLAARFESIGQGCHFGLIQRACGVEPLSLLRFVDTTTAMLYEGLCAGFKDIDAPDRFELHTTDRPRPTYRWRQRDYNLWFDTRVPVDAADPTQLMHTQRRRLAFLRRKFLEDVADADKIFVQTRTDCLTDPEALAVFCALRLHGPATLLWTVFGDATAAGRVERIAPGLLCGHLGEVDFERYAGRDVWVEVMQNVLF